MSRIVVFDLGQVIVQWDPYETQRDHMTRPEWEAFIERTNFWAFNYRLDSGESLREALAWFAAHYPDDVDVFSRYIAHYPRSLRGVVPGMREIVADLHARSVATGVLSNWPVELFSHALERIDLIAELGPRVISGEVKLAKPDPRIFDLVVAQHRARPADIVFVDDISDNVEAARRCGLDAVLFTSADPLRGELRARGLL